MSTNAGNTQIDVIVPVFNEEEILPLFHHRISALGLPLNLIYIDNGSSDRSREILLSFSDITVIKHHVNEGYGSSIIDGIINSGNEKIVIIDADCEYPPEAIPEMIKRLETAEVVYASRFIDDKNRNMPISKRLGNQLISTLFNVLFRQSVTDLYTGCKALNRSVLQGIDLHRHGFEHVLELGAKIARKNVAIEELPIIFSPRHTGTAKMKHFSETLKYLYLIVYYFLTVRTNG